MNIYSLIPLAILFKAANRRYLEYISTFDIQEAGHKRLDKVTRSKQQNNRTYKGINFFSQEDLALFLVILRGEYNIAGFRNKVLRKRLPGYNTGKVSRLLKRLHVFGIIKKATKSYRYYLTKLGKELVVAAERLKATVLIPALNY